MTKLSEGLRRAITMRRKGSSGMRVGVPTRPKGRGEVFAEKVAKTAILLADGIVIK